MNFLSRTATLIFLARLTPQVEDALKPHTYLVSEKVRHIMISEVIKSVTAKIKDPEVAKELHTTGKNLFNAASETLSFDDDVFPWHPKPWWDGEVVLAGSTQQFFSGFGEEFMLNPQPLPPHEQAYYGAILTMLSEAVSLEHVATSLFNIGTFLMKQHSRKEAYA